MNLCNYTTSSWFTQIYMDYFGKINWTALPRRRILCMALLSCLLLQVHGEMPVFSEKLPAEDRRKVENGEVVIRKLGSVKDLCISTSNPCVQKAVQSMKKLKPVYIAEIIRVYPCKGNEDLPERFRGKIMDIPSYAGIPYYSEHGGKWYDLYSSAEIVSQESTRLPGGAQTETVLANLEMSPFGLIETRIESMLDRNGYYYESRNLNKLRYHDQFTCVQPQKMQSVIAIFRSGDQWILYGIGGVNAPDVFFLRNRIEISFINRIKTFCSYFFTNF